MQAGEGTSLSTKVYYYLDDSTPYLSVIPVSDEKITLGDFKKFFAKEGYKYFCKQLDKAIGCEVKVEIGDDAVHLEKSANGLIELVLLSNSSDSHVSGTSTLPRASKKKTKTGFVQNRPEICNYLHNDLKLRKKRSVHELSAASDSTDGRRNLTLKSNENSVKANSLATVISKRAGEGLADLYTSNSEDPYRFDDMNSRLSMQSGPDSSTYAGVPAINPNGLAPGKAYRQRKPRRERFRKAYVPSTISSVTESSRTSLSLPRIIIISLSMRDSPYLGISVVGHEGGIFVSGITKGGAIAKDGRIEIGDQIIQINRTSFENLSEKQAVQLLKQVAMSRRPVTLYVAKRPCTVDSRSDILSGLASETLPIDISLWVESTQQQNCMKPQFANDKTNSTVVNSLPTDNEGIIESACIDGRDTLVLTKPNMKGHFDGVKFCSAEDIARRKENEENEQLVKCLRLDMDATVILKHMARPDSGLQIKNRKWLKIPVPMSFIGRDLVDWLLDNVHGLQDRKAARTFASQLLTQGYIKHVVNKLTFTEKCYYVFDESILSIRNTNQSNSSNGKAGAESTTEVTYVGSPAPPLPPRIGLRNYTNPAHKLPGDGDETWPLSPITNVCDPARRKSGCESPLTNDYASVIGPEVITSTMLGATTTEISPLNLSRHEFSHHVIARQRIMDDVLVSQPPNTPSSLSLAQNNILSAASETEFEVIDEDRCIFSNARC